MATPMLTQETAPVPNHRYTVEEYLAFERGSMERHEYFQGDIFALVNSTERHGSIVSNIIGELHQQLKHRPAELYIGQMRLHIPATGLYTYADASAVAEKPQFRDSTTDTLLNPTLIVEVFSPSTAEYDRGIKFQHYQCLESLRQYLLFAEHRCFAELLTRGAGKWTSHRFTARHETIPLTSIGCELKLDEVCDKVRLATEPHSS